VGADGLIHHGERVGSEHVVAGYRGQQHPVTRVEAAPAAERCGNRDVGAARQGDHAARFTAGGYHAGVGGQGQPVTAGPVLLDGIRQAFPRLAFGWADQGYRGRFLDRARQAAGVDLQAVARRDGGMRRSWAPAGAPPRAVPRFAVVPRRRVVERTFAWLGRCRRLSKDYEYLPATSENAIYLAMTLTLARRLARAPT
jgi:putative transposase